MALYWYREDEQIKISAYVQFFGVEKSDSFANFSGIEVTLLEIKTRFPELEVLYLSSDNAANYHSNPVLCWYIPRLAMRFKLKSVKYEFKEAQKGKVKSDRRNKNRIIRSTALSILYIVIETIVGLRVVLRLYF